MPHKIRIAIVGAGETGAPLLEQLLSADFVKIVGIADLDDKAPGIVLAQSKGVRTYGDFMDLARLGEDIDILIDVTGVHKVRDGLRQYMRDSDNHHTVIMHELIAVLLLSLSKGELVRIKHGDLDY
ncbi:oxidoreductase [Skermanella stibiiresistens SB22]|jgi:acetaldehyde dehydrogenase (acetylating)|uniref:Oxidoreductase n=1 Tax=Skermanella stibiiresistens SB22 TaxID=1385369 RepID=W9GX02_9PROT|nr:oxidoreductase [Skermanella stibiiresistens]EWY37131.1 oxidoreductase [Skermanella stibiiresistens SB22]